MFIELPHTLSSATDLLLDPAEDFEMPETVTAERPPRGSRRGADSGSRIRLAPARDAAKVAMRTGVAADGSFGLTFTIDA